MMTWPSYVNFTLSRFVWRCITILPSIWGSETESLSPPHSVRWPKALISIFLLLFFLKCSFHPGMGLISQHSISICLAIQACDLAVHAEKGATAPFSFSWWWAAVARVAVVLLPVGRSHCCHVIYWVKKNKKQKHGDHRRCFYIHWMSNFHILCEVFLCASPLPLCMAGAAAGW